MTVSDGKVLLDPRVEGIGLITLEIGEAIDLASEMLGAAMIAEPAEQGFGALGSGKGV